MFPFSHKSTNLDFFIFKGYWIENILQQLTGLQFDICYVFKLHWQINLLFKIVNLKILENPQEYVYSEVIFFIKPLNAKLLLNFSAEIFIFKYF